MSHREGIEVKVPPGKYPLATMGRLIEAVLHEVEYDLDWSAWVEQKDDTTLIVHYMAVN